MTSLPLILAEELTKVYPLYNRPIDRLKESLHPFRKQYHHDFRAVDHISFALRTGETLGIIGRNGSGKSTLLKMLTGVLTPTSGTLRVNGRISALLELGAGFNPELNGIENIYFNGLLLGYDKKAMAEKIDEIVAFADLGEHILQPVKTYSSGMAVRLAFSVAVHVEPEILIIDEALSVGDARFQFKAIRKIEELKKKSQGVIFVSHDLTTIRNHCSTVYWLDRGRFVMVGEPDDVTNAYYQSMVMEAQASPPTPQVSAQGEIRGSEAVAQIEGVRLCDPDTLQVVDRLLTPRRSLRLAVRVKTQGDLHSPNIGVRVKDVAGNYVLGFSNWLEQAKLGPWKPHTHRTVNFGFVFPDLKNGVYAFEVSLSDGSQETPYHHHRIFEALQVEVCVADRKHTNGFWFIPEQVTITEGSSV